MEFGVVFIGIDPVSGVLDVSGNDIVKRLQFVLHFVARGRSGRDILHFHAQSGERVESLNDVALRNVAVTRVAGPDVLFMFIGDFADEFAHVIGRNVRVFPDNQGVFFVGCLRHDHSIKEIKHRN